jgi:hypothetical protein
MRYVRYTSLFYDETYLHNSGVSFSINCYVLNLTFCSPASRYNLITCINLITESNKRRIEATEMDALRRSSRIQEKIKLEIQPLDNKL